MPDHKQVVITQAMSKKSSNAFLLQVDLFIREPKTYKDKQTAPIKT